MVLSFNSRDRASTHPGHFVTMAYHSKYFDTTHPENLGEDWTTETLSGALSDMEEMSREELVALCDHPDIGLTFASDDWREFLPIPDILAALLIQYYPTILICAIDQQTRE